MGSWRLAAGAAMVALLLGSCGSGQSSSLFTTDIRSNRAADGFVTRTVPAGTDNAVPALDNGAVQAGIDPVTSSESRAFLDVPLEGAGGVPAGARIVTAFLQVHFSGIDAIGNATFPIVLEIVPPFHPLDPSDFDAVPASGVVVTRNIFPSVDRGNFVDIDVAPLLEEALGLGLRRLEVRVRPGLPAAAPGLVRIEDLAIFDTAPRLQVEYFPP